MLLVAYLIFTVTFWLVMTINIGFLFAHGPVPWLEMLAGSAMAELGVFGVNVTYNPVTSTACDNVIVPLPFLALDLFYGLHWALGLLLNLMWGMVFSIIYSIFYKRMDPVVSTTGDGGSSGRYDVLQVAHIF